MSTKSVIKFSPAIFAIIFSFMMVMVGCSTSDSAKSKADATVNSESGQPANRVDLTDRLKRIPGVLVTGEGPNAIVTISGNEGGSYTTNQTPLFILDGQTLNMDYQNIYWIVNGVTIKSIRLVKGAEAAFAGTNGANSAIIIESL